MDKQENENSIVKYLLANCKNNEEELKYDFMPQILEIIERPACKMGKVIIYSILTLFFIAIIWASVSKIDVVVISNGAIQPIGNLNVVQAYSNGTVTSINVTEGEYVEEGDILIELDTESLGLDVDNLNNQKDILEAQWYIYTRISNGADVSIVDVTAYKYALRPYIQEIIDVDMNHRNVIADLEVQRDNANLDYEIAKIQLDEYRSYGTWNQVNMQELVIEQCLLSIEQIELKIANTKIAYNAQINKEISNINSKLDEIEANLEKYNLSLEYQNIIAPVSGVVHSIEVNTYGETVTVGQDLIMIVPDDMPMEMVCYVKNMDIADIKLGMEAEIKLEAYPYNEYGTVKGIVNYISPSAFSSEDIGSVYIVKIGIIDKADNIDIVSGLSGVVEIKIGNRRVIEYFMEPIIKGFGSSLKEK
ncbi:MAG: HlyD family efflux transporter periplasmic adaptor subunit [Lachnospiraceae bacterium]|nr:HlyD family efflux transporter periplasmic adaptor subunit [Lachnospiraceae bacterium]